MFRCDQPKPEKLNIKSTTLKPYAFPSQTFKTSWPRVLLPCRRETASFGLRHDRRWGQRLRSRGREDGGLGDPRLHPSISRSGRNGRASERASHRLGLEEVVHIRGVCPVLHVQHPLHSNVSGVEKPHRGMHSTRMPRFQRVTPEPLPTTVKLFYPAIPSPPGG